MGDRASEFRSAVERAKPDMSAGDRVLLEEACRLIDRSDRLDALLGGDLGSWLELDIGEDRVVVVVSSPLTEARQIAAELRQTMKALEVPAGAAVEKPRSGLDEIAARRRKRAG